MSVFVHIRMIRIFVAAAAISHPAVGPVRDQLRFLRPGSSKFSYGTWTLFSCTDERKIENLEDVGSKVIDI